MGFMDKIMFWKREEPALPDMPNFSMPGMNEPSMSMPGLDSSMPGMGMNGMPGQQEHQASGLGIPELGSQAAGQKYPSADAGMPEFPQSARQFNVPHLEEMPNQAAAPAAQQGYPAQQHAPQQAVQHGVSERDMEIISLKIDSMKSTLEAINQRLAHLERIAEGDFESRRRY